MFPEARFSARRPPPPVERITLADLGDAERRALDAEMDHLLGPFPCPVYARGRCDGTRKTVCVTCGARGHGNCEGWGRRPVDLVTCCDARPPYSGSLEAAGALIDRMRLLGWDCALFWPHAGDAQVVFLPRGPAARQLYDIHRHPWEETDDPDPWHSGDMTAHAATPARAICLAVLAVLNAFTWLRRAAMSHAAWGRHPAV